MVNSNEEHPVDDNIQETTEVVESEEVVEPTEEIIEDVEEVNPDGYKNAIGRIGGVFFDPIRAMTDVVFKRGWVWPLLFFIVCLALFNIIAGDVYTDFGIEQSRTRMQDMVSEGRISQEQADTIMDQQINGPTVKVMMWINPLVSAFFMKFVYTLLALLVGNIILGGSQKFKNYWATVWYAGVIGGVGMVVTAILVAVTNDVQGAQLGLGIFTKADPKSTAHLIAQAFNIFTIWEAIVLGIGVSKNAKAGIGKGIAWMLAIQLGIGIAFSLIGGAFM